MKFTSLEKRILNALAEALFPTEVGAARKFPSADEIDLVGILEGWFGFSTHSARLIAGAMLAGFDLSSLISRARLFHHLSVSERMSWIGSDQLAGSKLAKETLSGLQTLLRMAYATAPQVKGALGYDETPLLPLERAPVPVLSRGVALRVRHFPEISPGTWETDVVIVGSGAGGSVVAATLANAGLSVVVIEEGALHDIEELSSMDAGSRLFSLYKESGLTFTYGAPPISLPLGQAVGGTTVVNSGTCFRTPDRVLDQWSRMGVIDVSPEQMSKWFDEVEKTIGVMEVPDHLLGRNGEILRDAAQALGWSGGPIRRNIRSCHGYGMCVLGCPIGAKQAMHLSYLPKAQENGAEILAFTRARRVLLEHGHVQGIEAELLDPVGKRKVGKMMIHAKATVLAAGAISTPAFLLRQQLGGSSGQLGRNLVIHPGAGTSAVFDEELKGWRGTLQSYYVDEHLDKGILLEATFPPPGIGYSAGSLPLEAGSYEADGGGDKDVFALYPRMASLGSIISDGGNGRVYPIGLHGELVRYKLSKNDAAKVIEGIALASELYLTAGAKVVYPMLPGLQRLTSKKDIERLRSTTFSPGDLHLSAYHPMGTARMGSDERTSVVDSWGSVWDVPGLWIMDASIIPSSTMVNPQITIMALAARCASRLADLLM
ncbi:MAG: GMC family oxidoreductase [Actinobacteria bacterium]|nr:GMC family oxidoreductase [Actinomycetota bacterium]